MTKTERVKIRRAIGHLMGDECEIAEAMAILGPMCGLRLAINDYLESFKPVAVAEVAKRPNTFMVAPRRKNKP